MPVLPNPRHERFAQGLAGGRSRIDAYAEAGYRRNYSAATRLAQQSPLQARVAEIQGGAAERTQISIASLTQRLLRIADTAEKGEDAARLSVARAALMDAAKVNGLIADKASPDSPGAKIAVYSSEPLDTEQWSSAYAPIKP